MAGDVIERIRAVSDKPIAYVVLSHYHAVRVLGASAYGAREILASEACRGMIAERGEEDWKSEFQRFPRLFRAAESIPGLTWPTITFEGRMTVHLGRRRVELLHLGRGHTAGDVVVWVPDSRAVFSGDLVEHRSACYCGDAHFADWPRTLDRLAALGAERLVPGRGEALQGPEAVEGAIAATRRFLVDTWEPVARAAAHGASLKACFDEAAAHLRPRYADYAIFEHCLPFNVARAYDEACGIAWPRVWTAERDRALWTALQG
jgi:glyoxylase-like metal-dependent hydrolase (beta-lactamase superfamily II)